MAFLSIGKKGAAKKAADKKAAGADPVEAGDDAAAAPAPKPAKKGMFGLGGKNKTAAAPKAPKAAKGAKAAVKTAGKPASKKASGDLDIYTAVLAAAAVALAAGCVIIALDNLGGVEGTSDEGNPFAVVSSR